MIDITLLRDNPEALAQAIQTKKFACDFRAILKVDQTYRDLLLEVEEVRAKQNAANKAMAALDKKSSEFKEKIHEMKAIATQAKELDQSLKALETEWNELRLAIPNVPHPSVPVGKTEEANQVLESWGDTASISPDAIAHYDIPDFGDAIDFPRGAKVAGAGFPFYRGDTARLVRALISFFLEEARAAAYEELMAPYLVNEASARATGQLPDKEGQMYHVQSEDFYLIPTAEIPVTNFYRDEILPESALPMAHAAYTPCFRREAGSWGAHVRGLNRLHQFDKVELVRWVHPDKSFDELESLRAHAESLLQKLELPYRRLLICTGDLGFPHSKQYDLEVWAGGQKRWLEVSSCSNFTDFQARRAGIRFRSKDGEKPRFVHTLNGSALAIPRTLAALIENNYQKDGTVKLPEALHPFLGATSIHLKKN